METTQTPAAHWNPRLLAYTVAVAGTVIGEVAQTEEEVGAMTGRVRVASKIAIRWTATPATGRTSRVTYPTRKAAVAALLTTR